MFVLFLATNEKPEIRDYSDGFWERVHLVPFEHQFLDADRDPTVKTRLKGDDDHLQAILAWAVEGCLLWQKEGLNPPPEVLEATEDYREDSQPLSAFLRTDAHLMRQTLRRFKCSGRPTRNGRANCSVKPTNVQRRTREEVPEREGGSACPTGGLHYRTRRNPSRRVTRWKWQVEKGPLWPREKGPPMRLC